MLPPLYLLENNQQAGPFQEAQVLGMIQQGRVNAQTMCWSEGMAAWAPLGQSFPALFAGVRATAPPPASGSAVFEVIQADLWKMPKITLRNEEVVLEAGALRYMKGNIEIDSQLPSIGGFLKSALTKESAVKPRYRGTGEIFLEPTFGEVNIMELNGEAWVLDKGAFLASDRTVEVGMHTNKAMAGLFGEKVSSRRRSKAMERSSIFPRGRCRRSSWMGPRPSPWTAPSPWRAPLRSSSKSPRPRRACSVPGPPAKGS